MLCNCRIVPAMQMALQVVMVEELHCKWRWSFEGSLARNAFSCNPIFFHTKSVPNLDDLPLQCDGLEEVSEVASFGNKFQMWTQMQ